jgi:hypothetical protein
LTVVARSPIQAAPRPGLARRSASMSAAMDSLFQRSAGVVGKCQLIAGSRAAGS